MKIRRNWLAARAAHAARRARHRCAERERAPALRPTGVSSDDDRNDAGAL